MMILCIFSALCPEQSPGSTEHVAPKPSTGLCFATSTGSDENCGSRDRPGECYWFFCGNTEVNLERGRNYLIVLLNRQLNRQTDLSFYFLENSASPDKYPNTDGRQSSASPQCWASLRSRCANEPAESSGSWGPAYGMALPFNISFICLRMSFSFQEDLLKEEWTRARDGNFNFQA